MSAADKFACYFNPLPEFFSVKEVCFKCKTWKSVTALTCKANYSLKDDGCPSIVFYNSKSCVPCPPRPQSVFPCSRLSLLQCNFSKLCATAGYHRVLLKTYLPVISSYTATRWFSGQVRICTHSFPGNRNWMHQHLFPSDGCSEPSARVTLPLFQIVLKVYMQFWSCCQPLAFSFLYNWSISSNFVHLR